MLVSKIWTVAVPNDEAHSGAGLQGRAIAPPPKFLLVC